MIKAVLAFLFLFSSSFAGVRTVGNGGGFGEMKAYLAFQQMGRQIRLCLAVTSVCSLDPSEKTLLNQVLQSLENERGGVQFFNDPTLTRTVESQPYIGSPLFINSSLLTESTGVAATFEKISGYVLYGLLQHQKLNVNSAELWQFAANVFTNFQESSSSNAFLVGGKRLQLHHLQVVNIQDSGLIYDGLLIEDQQKTVDLLAETDLASLCPNRSHFIARIKSQSPGPRNGDLSVPISWSCDSENWGEAILYFAIDVDSNAEVILPVRNTIRGLVKPFTGTGG